MKQAKLPSSMKKTFISYVSKNIDSRSIVVFIPPWYEYLELVKALDRKKLIDEQMDLRLLTFKFHKGEYSELLSYISALSRRGRVVFWYPEYLREGYRGVDKHFLTLFSVVRDRGVVFITRNYSLYKGLIELGYGGYEFRELGVEETINEFGGRIDKDLLYLAEGNIGVLRVLGKYSLSDDIILNYVFDYYGYFESGQRKIIYYLSTRTLGNRITRIYGSETYVFLKRLMDRGIILKLEGKGNYLIRDPLLRIIIHSKVFGGKSYRIAGWIYLLVKMLLGAGRGRVIDTPTGRLFIGPPIKFKWTGDRSIRFLTADERTYTLVFHDDLSTLDYVVDRFRYEDDTKILLVPFEPNGRHLMKMKKKKVLLFTPKLLYMLSSEFKFPRVI